MVRLPATLFLLLLLQFFPSNSSATLVVLIPTKDGLIVAADSCVIQHSSLKTQPCDHIFKIIELENVERAVIAVAGTSQIFPAASDANIDLCRHAQSTSPALDLQRIAKDYLDRKGQKIDETAIKELAEHCKDTVQSFGRAHSTALLPHADQILAVIVVGHYDIRRNKSVMANFRISLTQQLTLELSNFYWKEVDEKDLGRIIYSGELDYVTEKVRAGTGKKFLKEYASFVSPPPRTIRQITSDEAKAAAVNLIEATSKTMELNKDPVTVGGPVDVVLLGKDPRPFRLKWKKP